ncbi:hypothetical protein N9D80_03095, partial [Flavobacteriales bacterium]|nr:hypothetical protein [Flavobacteriales bacterium]
NSIDENIEIIRKQEGLNSKEDVIEILESNGIDLSQFKKEESVNELRNILDKIIKLWEEKVKLNPIKMDIDLLNKISSDILTTMNIQGVLEKIQDVLSPKFNRVRIEREDEIFFASITTNIINEFVSDFGINNFDKLVVGKLQNILSEKDKESYSKLISINQLPTPDDLNNIFNSNLLEVNKNYENYLSNFGDWKLSMKIALLNNCGYVDNEQNNKEIKELLLSIENANVSVN